MKALLGSLVLLAAASVHAADPPAGVVPSALVAQLGTGPTSRVDLICLSSTGGVADWDCASSADAPRWTVKRCGNEGCEDEFPMTMDSPTAIHFNSTARGLYVITWTNGETGTAEVTLTTYLRRGAFQFSSVVRP